MVDLFLEIDRVGRKGWKKGQKPFERLFISAHRRYYLWKSDFWRET